MSLIGLAGRMMIARQAEAVCLHLLTVLIAWKKVFLVLEKVE